MDVNKNTPLMNNPWVLCPSKSFPGKFYYFNVQNGEAVWTLNCKENIRSKSYKTDTYREATTPPIYSPEKISANILQNSSQEQKASLQRSVSQNNSIFSQQTQIIGQQKPIISHQIPIIGQQTPIIGQLSNLTNNLQQFIPNIFWTPLQIPILSYISSDSVKFLPEPRFERMVETAPMDKKYFVHSTGVPLYRRFVNYEKPSNVNKEKKYHNIFSSTPQYSKSNYQFQNQRLNSNLESSESIFNEESITIMNSFRPKTPDNFETKDMESEFPKDIPVYSFDRSGSFVNMETDSVMNDDIPHSTQVGSKNLGIDGNLEYSLVSSNSLAENESIENIPSNIIPTDFCNTLETRNEIPKCSAENTNSFSNIVSKSANQSAQILSRELQMFENNLKSFNKEKVSTSSYDHDEDHMLNVEQENNLENLSSTDLRFHLLAKRRKSEADGVLGYVEKKKPKLQEKIQKKKVTFNLDNLQEDTGQNYRIARNFTPIDIHEDYHIKFTSNDCTNFRKTLTEKSQNNINLTDKATITNNNLPIYKINCDTEKENSVRLIKNHTNYKAISLADEYENMLNKNCDNDFDQVINNYTNSTEKDITFDNPNYIPFRKETANRSITIYNTPKMTENALISNIHMQDQIIDKRQKYIQDLRSQANTKINLHNKQLKENIAVPSLQINENSNIKLNKNIDIENEKNVTNLNETGRQIPIRTVDGAINKRNDSNEDIIDKMSIFYKDVWYLVVDLDVLLDDHLLVDKLVQSDDKCRLLVPSAIRNELEALCIGDCRGQQRVLIARQISRRIDGLDKRIIVERTYRNEDNEANTTDLILKCCLNAVENQYYVVLLTNDGYLKNRAKSLKIHSYTPQEIKKGAVFTPKLFTDLKKMKLTVDNTALYKRNSFEQNKTLNLSKNNIPTNLFNRQLINGNQSDNNCDILFNITKSKSDTRNISNNFSQSHLTDNINRLNLEDLDSLSSSPFSRDMYLQKQIPNKIIHNQKENSETHTNNFKEPIESSVYTKSHNSVNKETIKSVINNTSACANVSDKTDDVRSNFKNPQYNFEGSLEKFTIKDNQMYFTIKTRMDEWICSYTQIMNELFGYIIQKNYDYFSKVNATTASIHEILTNIKMLYRDAKLKHIIEVLVKLLTKNSCSKDKIKLDTKPQDFLQIIGYSVLLVQSLKVIIPDSLTLFDCELYFEYLLNNMESHNIDIDLDLLRPTVICRSDVVDKNESRINFAKDRSHVIDYLKKHFKEWADVDDIDIGYNLCSENIKVIRMEGKNINKIKIDNKKSVSCTQTSKENISEKDETKIIKLLENNVIVKSNNAIKSAKNDGSILRKLLVNSQHLLGNSNSIELIYQTISEENTKSKEINSNTCDDFPTNGNTFDQNNDTNGPKVVLNLNSLDNFKDKNQNKEPLNMKTLDNTENNNAEKNEENNIDSEHLETIDIDDEMSNKSIIISYKNISKRNLHKVKDTTKKIVNEEINDNCNKIINEDILECDYSDNINLNDIYGSRKNTHIHNGKYITNEENYDTDDRNNGNCAIRDQINGNCVIDNTNNGKCVITDISNGYCVVDDINNGICVIHDQNNGNHARKGEINGGNADNENGINDIDKINDDYNGNDDKYDYRNYLISQLTSKENVESATIYSGIENESTQAHTIVKTFLSELAITFKVIYKFIDNFTTEIRKQNLSEDRKYILCNKASRCLETMVALTLELEIIIQRESNDDTTLKNLFLRAGVEAATDKRITRYRQIIIKCLEQAQILLSSLKIIVCITTGDFKAIYINSDTICTNMKYFNIFE